MGKPHAHEGPQKKSASVDVISRERKPLQAFKHHQPSTTVDVDKTLDDVPPDAHDAVLLPGGALNAGVRAHSFKAERNPFEAHAVLVTNADPEAFARAVQRHFGTAIAESAD